MLYEKGTIGQNQNLPNCFKKIKLKIALQIIDFAGISVETTTAEFIAADFELDGFSD